MLNQISEELEVLTDGQTLPEVSNGTSWPSTNPDEQSPLEAQLPKLLEVTLGHAYVTCKQLKPMKIIVIILNLPLPLILDQVGDWFSFRASSFNFENIFNN